MSTPDLERRMTNFLEAARAEADDSLEALVDELECLFRATYVSAAGVVEENEALKAELAEARQEIDAAADAMNTALVDMAEHMHYEGSAKIAWDALCEARDRVETFLAKESP